MQISENSYDDVQTANELGYRTATLVSVVITTRNEENMIEDCIMSILEQDYANYEQIVVDAKSSDSTFQKISGMASKASKKCKRFLFLSEEADTPAKGRNIGVRAAYGDIIAFTDGDCIAEKDWITNLVSHIPEESGCVGGPNILKHSKKSKILDAIDSVLGTRLGSGGSPQFLRIEKVSEVYAIPSCNFAIQKKLFDNIGGFDERLRFNEDSDLCNRIRKKGHKIIYAPHAKVNHFMELNSFSAFSGIIYKYGLEAGKNTKRNVKLFQRFRLLSFGIVLSILALATFSFFTKIALLVLTALILLIVLIVVSASAQIGVKKKSFVLAFLSVPIFFSIFTFYNVGFLFGCILWLMYKPRGQNLDAET